MIFQSNEARLVPWVLEGFFPLARNADATKASDDAVPRFHGFAARSSVQRKKNLWHPRYTFSRSYLFREKDNLFILFYFEILHRNGRPEKVSKHLFSFLFEKNAQIFTYYTNL